jgi:hypothetical protein
MPVLVAYNDVVMSNPTGRRGVIGLDKRVAREAASKIVEDPIYLGTLLSRARAGTLHAAIEQMLWHYRYGKPVDRVEVTAPKEDLSSLTVEELAKRAQLIAEDLRLARTLAEEEQAVKDVATIITDATGHSVPDDLIN